MILLFFSFLEYFGSPLLSMSPRLRTTGLLYSSTSAQSVGEFVKQTFNDSGPTIHSRIAYTYYINHISLFIMLDPDPQTLCCKLRVLILSKVQSSFKFSKDHRRIILASGHWINDRPARSAEKSAHLADAHLSSTPYALNTN